MILKGSQRGGAKQLAQHLLKTEENEQVELHEIRGFVSNDLTGALMESYAVSRGTRCKQFMFSLSLNPPQNESVGVEVFEDALARIEKKMGLESQPRAVVFHEKEGRRHAHAVWSRIDATEMKAINLPHTKLKLRDVSRELFMEHGWQMPRGLMNSEERSPLNFTLDEWQQAKRAGHDPRNLKSLFRECWAMSDSRAAFAQALKERGFHLAQGDRRGFVAVDYQGEVFAIPRMTGVRTKAVREKLGDPKDLPGVDETKAKIAKALTPMIKGHIDEAKERKRKDVGAMRGKIRKTAESHRQERHTLGEYHAERRTREHQIRMKRLAKGLRGIWERVTGKRRRIERHNEAEASQSAARDRAERQALIDRQLEERRKLQTFVKAARQRHAAVMKDLHRDIAHYDEMSRLAPPPDLRRDFAGASRRRARSREPGHDHTHEPG